MKKRLLKKYPRVNMAERIHWGTKKPRRLEPGQVAITDTSVHLFGINTAVMLGVLCRIEEKSANSSGWFEFGEEDVRILKKHEFNRAIYILGTRGIVAFRKISDCKLSAKILTNDTELAINNKRLGF